MNCDQRMGIVLPMKILIWEDESKVVKAGFINPEKYLKEYDLEKCKEVLPKLKLSKFAAPSVSPQAYRCRYFLPSQSRPFLF